jgi:GNAT superfamily N-acetyltransferase
MIVPKNKHLEAARAILGSTYQGKSLLKALEGKEVDQYQFVTKDSNRITEAILLVNHEGSTTTCIPTPPKSPDDIERIGELVLTGLEEVRGRGSKLAQAIMGVNDSLLASACEYAGFDKLAILTYMERATSTTSPQFSIADVSMLSSLDSTEEEIRNVLQETYIGSLDCPKIHGLRTIEDIIRGHRGQGVVDSQLWTIASLNNIPAGILILNPVQEAACMELIYLGCTPQSRGQGVGNALMQLAIQQTQAVGISRITLAVDSENSPAISLYARWNFKPTYNRITFIKKLY